MSSILTLRDITESQSIILTKLGGYTKPVKTKHLADRLRMDRSDLVADLNQLRSRGAVRFVKGINQKEKDHRGRDDINFGWVLVF